MLSWSVVDSGTAARDEVEICHAAVEDGTDVNYLGVEVEAGEIVKTGVRCCVIHPGWMHCCISGHCMKYDQP